VTARTIDIQRVLVLHVALKSALDEQKHRAQMGTILRR